jgi:hypothetical protein
MTAMPRRVHILSALAAATFSMAAAAEESRPEVRETDLAAYDLAGARPGDWVEYERRFQPGNATRRHRMACVAVDGKLVTVETDEAAGATHPGTLLVLQADRESSKVVRAWWGKAGGEAKELEVKPAPADPEAPAPAVKVTGTGRVARETVKAAGREFDCEKVTVETSAEIGGERHSAMLTICRSPEVPFPLKPAAERAPGVVWEGDPSGKGAVVRLVSESGGIRAEITLTGFGNDAKPTLNVK